MKPFLKWVGGKQRTAALIRSKFPTDGIHSYFEPFLGAGGVFLADPYSYPNNYLADINSDLCQVWGDVVNALDPLLEHCQKLFLPKNNNADFYYGIRTAFNTDTMWGEAARSAAFIYLNKHGFNGLCRYNDKGKFNVPFGKYKKVSCPEFPVFERGNANVVIYNEPFQTFLPAFQYDAGCLIYCDPPYIPVAENSFRGYGSDWTDQTDEDLAKLLQSIARESGARVFCSNSYCERTINLYAGSAFHVIPTRRDVAADPFKRKEAFDYLIEVK